MRKSSILKTVLPHSYLCGRIFSGFVTSRVLYITEDGRQSQSDLSVGTVFKCFYSDVLTALGSPRRSHSNQKVLRYILGMGGHF